MWTPHPIPTMNPYYEVSFDMYDFVDQFFTKIINMLASVPVVPNSNGLFNPQTGEWYTPQVSFLDLIVAGIIIGTFFALIIKLSNSGGNITGGILSANSKK